MITVTLYSRKDCHLCDQTLEDLTALQAEFPHQLKVIDIDSSANLQKSFGDRVPVVTIGPYILQAPIERTQLAVSLGAAQDRESHISRIDNTIDSDASANERWTRSDRFTYWTSRHYLAGFNLFLVVYLGLTFLAPVLMKAGYTSPAALIYRIYGGLCHQLAFRSVFIFGEQPYYPRAAAGVGGLLTFQQATGISESSTPDALLAARQFVGNAVVGYKVALCERDIAIYGSMLLFGVIFALSRRKMKSLPWYLWIVVGILPIALDGFSQLLSQPPLGFIPYRESTPYLRFLTGFLFGFTTAWFGIPLVESSMAEARELMERKKIASASEQLPSGTTQNIG